MQSFIRRTAPRTGLTALLAAALIFPGLLLSAPRSGATPGKALKSPPPFTKAESVYWNGINRSLLLPGWGQYYRGRKVDAVIYGSAFLGLGLIAARYTAAHQTARRDYRTSVISSAIFSPFSLRAGGAVISQTVALGLFSYNSGATDEARIRARRLGRNADLLRSLTAAVYAISIADVAVFKNGLRLKLLGRADGADVGLTLVF